jgi:hypothetical protein
MSVRERIKSRTSIHNDFLSFFNGFKKDLTLKTHIVCLKPPSGKESCIECEALLNFMDAKENQSH